MTLHRQLKAIEKSFAEGGQETSINETVVQNPNSVVSNVSLDVEHSGKRKIDFHDQSTLPVANKVKKKSKFTKDLVCQ